MQESLDYMPQYENSFLVPSHDAIYYYLCSPVPLYCQKDNKQTQKYGHIPPKDVQHLQPWDEVCVDMIGPWKVTINSVE